MFLGHYGIGLAATRVSPRTGLGTLLAASVLPDLLWPVFLLTGLEKVVITTSSPIFVPLEFTSYPYSHSLVMTAVWGALLASGVYAYKRDTRGAVVCFLLTLSHWLCDLAVHLPDLQIAPGIEARFGFGLWRSLPLSIALEGGILIIGTVIYAGSTVGLDRRGSFGFAFLVLSFCVVGAMAFTGTPPPGIPALAFTSELQWLFILLGAWTDRHRRLRMGV